MNLTRTFALGALVISIVITVFSGWPEDPAAPGYRAGTIVRDSVEHTYGISAVPLDTAAP